MTDTNDEAIETCVHNPQDIEPHPCPFKEDVHHNRSSLCRCCPQCEHECTMEI